MNPATAGPLRASFRAERRVLGLLGTAGITYAFLHGADAWVAGECRSDLDLVVDRPEQAVLEALRREPALEVLAEGRYARGSTAAVVADTGSAGFVRLDLTYDPHGRGRLGIRTDALLARALVGPDVPRVDPDNAVVYRLLKRWVQSDQGALDVERAHVTAAVVAAATHALSDRGALQFRAALGGSLPSLPQRGARRAEVIALGGAERVRRPAAFVLGFAGAPAQTRTAAHAWVAWFDRYHDMEVPLVNGEGAAGTARLAVASRRVSIVADVSPASAGWPRLDVGVQVGDVDALVRIGRRHER